MRKSNTTAQSLPQTIQTCFVFSKHCSYFIQQAQGWLHLIEQSVNERFELLIKRLQFCFDSVNNRRGVIFT
jgi:hypothetical protein